MATPLATARSLAQRHGAVRSKVLEAAGVARAQHARMVTSGDLVRLARGLYALPGRAPEAEDGLQQVVRRHPDARLCLLTALRVHDLTTQAPFEVWIAIGHKDRPPRQDWPPLRVVRYSGESLDAGVITLKTGSLSVRVTNVAKTVADCFKFRNLVGTEVAIEALREALRARAASMDELWNYAKICRVTRVMRPYLEALAIRHANEGPTQTAERWASG